MPTENEKYDHNKIQAEIAKLMAETSKINRETWWYPLAVGSAFTLTLVTITAGIIKLFL